MLGSILRYSLRNSGVIIAALFLLLGFTTYSLRGATYDVFPEFAPPVVQVQTEAPGLSSQQVETLITQVVESALGGTKGVMLMRSTSIQGLSAIQLTFDLNSDILRDRQLINERISAIGTSLPAGVGAPTMSPLSSTTGNVMGIGLTSNKLSLTQLRTIGDWLVKPRLLSVQGVSDVEAYGGRIRQVQVQIRPRELVRYGLSFDEIDSAAKLATGVRGAGLIDTAQHRITINTSTDATTLQALASTPLTRGTGDTMDLSITLGDVATIAEGYQTPFSAASIMGQTGVLLMVTSQYGANTVDVTRNIEIALKDLRPTLSQQGVIMWSDIIRPSSFIEMATSNVKQSLLIGATLVIIILLVFLRNWRAAAISALAIPFSLLISAYLLTAFGWTLNTMSLGGLGIAVGLVVDDAVIDVENITRRLRMQAHIITNRIRRYQIIFAASMEVRVPVIFASLAVVLISIPVMTMPGVGGNFFAPLGAAYALATLVSLAISMTLTPALCMTFLHISPEEPRLAERLKLGYIRLLERFIHHTNLIYSLVAIPFIICIAAGFYLKSEFIPELHEGHFIVHMEMQPGTSLDASISQGNDVATALLKLPFVHRVVQQVGRTEGGIDIWGTHISEFNIALKPSMPVDETKAKADIEDELAKFSAANFEVSTFLTERVEEVISGYTSDAALNIYGNDLNGLDQASIALVEHLGQIAHVKDIKRPAEGNIPALNIVLDHASLERWGLEPTTVLDAIHTAYESEIVGQLYDTDHPTQLAVLIEPETRKSSSLISALPIHTPSGEYVTLHEIASIQEEHGRYAIMRDGGRRVQSIAFNIDGPNKAAVLTEVENSLNQIKLPPGVYVNVNSLTKEAQSDQHQLMMHTLFAGIGIILMLTPVLRSPMQIALLILNVPLAITGALITILLMGDGLTLGGMVGCIALLGVTLRNGVLLLSHYSYTVNNENLPWTPITVWKASSERLIPILMTAIVTGMGIMPIALASGEPGREIEGPMAITMLGGLLTSTVLTLFILPPLALKFCRFTSDALDAKAFTGSDLVMRDYMQ